MFGSGILAVRQETLRYLVFSQIKCFPEKDINQQVSKRCFLQTSMQFFALVILEARNYASWLKDRIVFVRF